MTENRNVLREHRGLLHGLFFTTHVDARPADLSEETVQELNNSLRQDRDTVRELLVEARGVQTDDADWEAPATRDQYWRLLRETNVDIRHADLKRAHATYLIEELPDHHDLVVAVLALLKDPQTRSPEGWVSPQQAEHLWRKTRVGVRNLDCDGGLTKLQASFLIGLLKDDPELHREWVRTRLQELQEALKLNVGVEPQPAAERDSGPVPAARQPKLASPAPRAFGATAPPSDPMRRRIVATRFVKLRRTQHGASLELPEKLEEQIPPEPVVTAVSTGEGILFRLEEAPAWLLPAGERSSFLRPGGRTWHLDVPSGIAERVPQDAEFLSRSHRRGDPLPAGPIRVVSGMDAVIQQPGAPV